MTDAIADFCVKKDRMVIFSSNKIEKNSVQDLE